MRDEGVTLELGGHPENALPAPGFGCPESGRAGGCSAVAVGARKGISRCGARSNWPIAFCDGRLIGITGSNGKTTTTSLVHHILRVAGFSTDGGGQHRDAADFVAWMLIERRTITVAELSSFQLELIETFRPDIAVFLNLTPDHLDRHDYGSLCGGEEPHV